MADQIVSRGPDDSGVWTSDSEGVCLAHRRLSIIDLSVAGHQPMQSPCGRFTLVFNGEIYNHAELRSQLDAVNGGWTWRGHSDTETLLAALRHWGVEGALQRLNGMFAFALWDAAERRLSLARDRMGEKPLYYGRSGGTFLFGSELKALRAHPDFAAGIDRDALTLYLRHNYIPAPHSIYRGIFKLPPAHYLSIRQHDGHGEEPACYWDLNSYASSAPATVSDEDALDELDALLRDAVGMRMIADVPLGAFLSGGIDSSTIVALMQAISDKPVRTFTIGFDEQGYNEAQHAKKVAEHLGTDHTELYVRPSDALAVIPKLPTIYDEPFSDSSQIPTFLVSEMARRHVKVCLSGDGGDELFYGYARYPKAERIWGAIGRWPLPLRRAAAACIANFPGGFAESVMSVLPSRLRIEHLADRLPKLAELLAHGDPLTLYRNLVSHETDPESIVIGGSEPANLLSTPDALQGIDDFRERMMYIDAKTYLPDDILTKVDRASMAVSLEARVPLLDHRVVEFSWRTPMSMKSRNGDGKWLLRRLLDRYVPREIMERPKMGFGVPIDEWLRGPLADWAEDLLCESRLRQDGYLNPAPIRRMWQEHRDGKRRWHYYLWDVLMFQAWLADSSPGSGSGR